MRKTIFAILTAAVAGCGGGGSGGTGGTASAPGEFVATSVAEALDYGIDNGLDGVWVYLDDGSGPPVFEAIGQQDRSTLAPASVTSLFKIASISKMFIAVCTVRLAETGTVQLDDTLAFWLPSLASGIDHAHEITVRQLLQHRSGVPDFDSQAGFSWGADHTDSDVLLGLVLDKPADFAPDQRYEYSNTNYLLLGRILDAALGYSHHDFVQNEILSPLGMTNTFSLLSDTDSALLARGYWNDIDRTEQDYVVPGGSMISTADDIGVFLRALANGMLLSPDEQQTYRSLFGRLGHAGWLPGYQSLAYFQADTGTVLVQFVNTTGGNSERIAQQMYDSLVQYLRNR